MKISKGFRLKACSLNIQVTVPIIFVNLIVNDSRATQIGTGHTNQTPSRIDKLNVFTLYLYPLNVDRFNSLQLRFLYTPQTKVVHWFNTGQCG